MQNEDKPDISKAELNNGTSTSVSPAEEIFASKDGPTRSDWMLVAGIFLLQFYIVGTLNAFGVFQDFYTTTFLSSYSASDVSWIGGIAYFFELGLAPIGGKLFDMGWGITSIIGGALMCSICFVLLSFAHPGEYYQVFLAQGLGMGIPLMLVFSPSMTLLSQRFKARRALAMGIVAASAPVGAILYTSLLNHLFSTIGFAWGVRSMAIMSFGCFIMGSFFVIYGSKSLPQITPRTVEGAIHAAPLWDAPYLLILASGFLFSLGGTTPNFYMQLFARQHGVEEAIVFNSFSILAAASILGRIIPGWMADRWGVMKVFFPSLIAVAAVIIGLLGCDNSPGLIMFAILFGYFFGTLVSVYLPLVASMTPPGSGMGRRMGLALTPIGIGSTIGPPIAGAVLGDDLSWWKVVLLSSILVAAAAGCALAAQVIYSRRVARDRIQLQRN